MSWKRIERVVGTRGVSFSPGKPIRGSSRLVVVRRSSSESLQLTLSEQRKRAAGSGRIADPALGLVREDYRVLQNGPLRGTRSARTGYRSTGATHSGSEARCALAY